MEEALAVAAGAGDATNASLQSVWGYLRQSLRMIEQQQASVQTAGARAAVAGLSGLLLKVVRAAADRRAVRAALARLCDAKRSVEEQARDDVLE